MFEKRAKSIAAASLCVFLLLSIRLSYISFYKGASYEAVAYNQQKREILLKTKRGKIFDRKKIPFTDNKHKKMYLNKNGEISSKKDDSVYEFDFLLREATSAKHLIGYTADDKGVTGIEKEYDNILKDKGNIYLSFMANAAREPVDGFNIYEENYKDSQGVVLTLDKHIQKITEEVMKKHIKKGAAVVLDIESFDVLSMVSLPDFDSQNIDKYTNSNDGELINRALLGYNAGSVFKIVTASSALKNNPLIKDRQFDCRGSFTLDETNVFKCHKEDGHGLLSFNNAFGYSCNCSFFVAGIETGGTSIIDTALDFGFGYPLLNANIGESGGNLPQREEYSNAETINLSIGQGEILITPLQCAVMAATVANGGVRKDTNIVLGIYDKDGNFHTQKNTKTTQVIDVSIASMLSQMMRECVLYGTGSLASKSKVSISGKTGSAETGWYENKELLVHGWFCGFFPSENPRYAMAILSEGGKSGAESCVEPFVEIAEKINEIYPFKQ